MITTLVVDDSASFRAALIAALQTVPGFKVVGAASSGAQAVSLAGSLRPTLVLMDAMMPDMDGVAATRAIMSESPCAIVMLTALGADQYQRIAFEALEAGAVDVMAKPDLTQLKARTQLLDHLKAMSAVRVVRRRRPGSPQRAIKLVLVGSSTGGPPAVRTLLETLPAHFPAPIVVAQHLANGFAAGLAQWLGECTALTVKVVTKRESLTGGTVYLAGDDCHLELDGAFVMAKPASGDHATPSVDRLMLSATRNPDGVVGVVLTGMGTDGLKGLLALRELGCVTFAQDEASSLVYGMPRAAVQAGAATEQLPPAGIAIRIRQLAGV